MAIKAIALKFLPPRAAGKLAVFFYSTVYNVKRALGTGSGKQKGFTIKKAVSLSDYVTNSRTSTLWVKEFTAEMIFSSPVFYPDVQPAPIEHCTIINKQVACIASAVMVGESNVILPSGNEVVYDFMFQWNDPNIFYTDPAVKHIDRNDLLLYINDTGISIKEGIHLTGNFSFNYYHFLYECIARLYYIDKSNIDPAVPLLVDETFLKVDQYHEILRIFNTGKRNIIPIQRHKAYHVGKLYYAACPHHIAPNYYNERLIKSADTLYDREALTWVIKQLESKFSSANYPKRIYLSRKRASSRRTFNEAEVLEVLQTQGFEEVFPEQYSFTEQITMFRNAEVIVSGSGAALSNILACKAGTIIICLVNQRHAYSYFSTLAALVGASLMYISSMPGTNKKIANIHAPFIVNVQQLKNVLSALQLKQTTSIEKNTESLA